ncbi:MAG: hypothetical protein AAFO04_20095 [Cyanobacteria bacterium J06592_8]
MKPQAYLYEIKTKYGFWLKWVFATAVGFFVSLLWIEIGERPDMGLLTGVVGGTTIGFAQWFVLREYINQPWQWIIANTLGWAVLGYSHIGALAWVAPRTLDTSTRIIYGIIDGGQVGIWIGFLQWLVLRIQVPRAWKWLWVSPLCWTIGLSIGWAFGGVMRQSTEFFLGDVLGLMLAWTLIAGMSGIALVRLLWILDDW